MNYFDLHCDTSTELFCKRQNLRSSECHISESTISGFDKYGQVFAVFSDPKLSDDEAYSRFFSVADYFKDSNLISYVHSTKDLFLSNCRSCILSVEDARILGGDLTRLFPLYDSGVRLMTYLWSGLTCIGGSFDTDEGLTPFGKDVVRASIKLGMIPDISHASLKSAKEIISIADTMSSPVIASHSNSYIVCPHPRNITDDIAKQIMDTGGVIGICLHSPHLGDSPDVNTILKHIDHLISVTSDETICLGCDFDGTDQLPDGFSNQADILTIATAMRRAGYNENTVNKVFFDNAYNFFKINLSKSERR